LALGLDIQQVNLVINYDFPNSHSAYIHRAGRCGRFGRKGSVISFLTENTERDIIKQYFNITLEEMPANIIDL